MYITIGGVADMLGLTYGYLLACGEISEMNDAYFYNSSMFIEGLAGGLSGS